MTQFTVEKVVSKHTQKQKPLSSKHNLLKDFTYSASAVLLIVWISTLKQSVIFISISHS